MLNTRLRPLLLVGWLAGVASAQSTTAPEEPPTQTQEGGELELFKLEDTLSQQTQVASARAKSLRESPGIITLITRDDIIHMGARDLADVLLQVPGLAAGLDTEGVADFGVRGNWGHEGKILLLIDGVEMNETLFSTLQFGNHFPADQLQSVEIIRGPGSAQYGGYAELAVINVHTRTTEDLEGVSVGGQYGQFPRGLAQRDLSLYAGHSLGGPDGLKLTFTGEVGQGNRSDQRYVDPAGNSFDMANGGSALDPLFLNLGAAWKDLSVRMIFDRYTVGAQDAYGLVSPVKDVLSFQSLFLSTQYEWHLSRSFKLVPRVDFQSQLPWKEPNTGSPEYYDKTALRTQARLTAVYDVTADLTLSAGLQGYVDHAKLNGDLLVGSQDPFLTGTSVQYTNVAAFAEAEYDSVIGNLLVGGRFEHNSAVGNSFVPRAALTKLLGRFHFKLLFSGAFRAPGIEDITLGRDVHPEHTWVGEAEVGYQLTDHMFLSVNGYDITINQPIIYTVDPATGAQAYLNFPHTGTRGVEADYKLQYAWGAVDLNYSFYTNAHMNAVQEYEVTGQPLAMLGMPQHKVALTARFKVWRDLWVDPSATLLSARFADVPAGNGALQTASLGATTLLNVYVLYKDLGIPGLDVGAGVFNLLNQANLIPEPYTGGHPPLAGARRDVLVHAMYTVPF